MNKFDERLKAGLPIFAAIVAGVTIAAVIFLVFGDTLFKFLGSLETKDKITLTVALWGAGLSSYLAYRQLGRDRKKLSIVLYRTRDGNGRMSVTNSGHRPISVTDIYFRAQRKDKDGTWTGGVYRHETAGMVTTEQGTILLPKLLTDGERIPLLLPDNVFEIIKDPLYQVFAWAKDGDHKDHTQYKLGDNWPQKPRKKLKIVME